MTQPEDANSCNENFEEIDEKLLFLELENYELKQKIKDYDFDRYKLQQIQQLAKAGSWELNHLSYDLSISDEMSSVLKDDSMQNIKISWHDFLTMISGSSHQDIKEKLLKDVIQDGKSLIFEHTMLRPDKSTIFVRQHCKTFYNTIGQPLTTVGLIIDITDEHTQALELEKLSITDELTLLYNRRHINEIMDEQLELFKRYQKTSSYIMIDIDHFKKVNDDFGHQIGDEILINAAKTIKDNLRQVDYAGRWGGEEFLIICQETVLESAIIMAEKLRKAFMDIQTPSGKHITASFGVGEIIFGENVDSIIERIDDALYTAKENGRNQVRAA